MALRAGPLALCAGQMVSSGSISASRVPEARRAFQVEPKALFQVRQGAFQMVPEAGGRSKSPEGGPKESGEEGKKKKGCHLDIPIFT